MPYKFPKSWVPDKEDTEQAIDKDDEDGEDCDQGGEKITQRFSRRHFQAWQTCPTMICRLLVTECFNVSDQQQLGDW